MKSKIGSSNSRHCGEGSSSSSSVDSRRDEFRKKTRKHKHKHHLERRDMSKKIQRSRSISVSDDGSSSDDSRVKPHAREKDRYSKKKKIKDEYSYGDVKIKEEPISDDERQRCRRKRSRSRSASRSSSNERHPVRHSRWSSGNNDRKYSSVNVKKERFSDIKKEPGENMRWGKQNDGVNAGKDKKPLVDKAKPDFGLSGKLAEETNTYNGVVIKYSEPPEARKPKRRWRLYPFKGDEGLPTMYIHRQSAYLIGRDRKVADLPIDHPSCSKQHAVFQYRLVPFERPDGSKGKRICLYIIDLESANGTFVNNVKIEPKKYVQLLEKDVIKFAFSSREYVLLHEHSKDSDADDDVC